MTTSLSLNLGSQNLLGALLNPNYGKPVTPTIYDAALAQKVDSKATASLLGETTTTDTSPLTDLASQAAQGDTVMSASEQQAALAQGGNAVKAMVLDMLA